MRLLVGLGNPGLEYAHTRHNAGFYCVDQVAKELDLSWKEERGGLIAKQGSGEDKILLFKPMQFMNTSGIALRAMLDYYSIDLKDVCVAADDVYIAPGSARIRHSGGDGGHNGWRSLHQHLTSDAFWRVRIGVGLYEQNPEKRQQQIPLDAFVLQKLPSHDQKAVEKLVDILVPNLIKWLHLGELVDETITINQ